MFTKIWLKFVVTAAQTCTEIKYKKKNFNHIYTIINLVYPFLFFVCKHFLYSIPHAFKVNLYYVLFLSLMWCGLSVSVFYVCFCSWFVNSETCAMWCDVGSLFEFYAITWDNMGLLWITYLDIMYFLIILDGEWDWHSILHLYS